MPIQLRPRLNCHYCGRRSKLSKKDGRRFQCDSCLAVNFFDENGDITDVPIEEAASVEQFAQPIIRDPLADHFSDANSIFCSTCLKNQHLYTQNLSQFLPDPDHPDYEKIEAGLPAFKKGLEKRYPQCCARCEPKVRAQLQKATYTAKSDHIRRVLDKSRRRRIASRFGWRSLLVNAAGVGYTLSLAVQLVWHFYGSQIQPSTLVDDLLLPQCIHQRPFNPQCLHLMERCVGASLGLSLTCLWWNPRWQHKLSNKEGRLVGLEKYYLVQFGLLFLRLSAWAVLREVPLSIRGLTILHAIHAVVLTLIALWSNFSIVHVRLTPSIDWNVDPAPLLSENQFIPPEINGANQLAQEQGGAFHVGNLASASPRSYEAWRPPTPPEDKGDSMDWTPSQPTFDPQPKAIRYTTLSGPSPFHGKLPAFPAKGVQSQSGHLRNEPKEAIGLPPGFFDRKPEDSLPPRLQQAQSEAMAQPKFFGHERQADTGLENIFETIFSFKERGTTSAGEHSTGDHPTTKVKDLDGTKPRVSLQHQGTSLQVLVSGMIIFLLLVALMIWLLEIAVKPRGSALGLYITVTSVVVPTSHFLQHMLSGQTHGHILRLLVFAIEASILIGLAYTKDSFEGEFQDLWNKVAIAAVALLLPQEFVRLISASAGSHPDPHAVGSRLPTQPADDFGVRDAHQRTVTPVKSSSQTSQFPSTSKARKLGLRSDSDESTESKATVTTNSASTRWESPSPHPDRYRWEPPENRPSFSMGGTGVSSGFNGLSLNDGATGGARNAGRNSRTPWDLPLPPSDPSKFDSRRRRGF